ncbi:MAG TPA: pectin acetylesterase-family hydrolase [Polyangiaceae bacterium]|nr:pectin acetylesterase-family hydrolase [Polyangiaceae bacterium]
MIELALLRRALCFALGTMATCACSSDTAKSGGVDGGAEDSGGPAKPGFSAAAIADLHASHVDKYLGKASLSDTTMNDAGDTVYNFATSDGPICYLGDQYHAIVHDAGSDNLLIFLQGGGACWETLCMANSTAETTMVKTGILNQDASNNTVGSWNIVYAPYCDGSVFSGDNDMMSPDGKQMWHFHGLANLSAVLDVAKKSFPNPKRILLAGTSGGGYGTLTGTALVRLTYPNTQVDVFNDAGLGLSNLMDPNMLATVKRDWKFDQFLPSSCSDCAAVQTALIGWGLGADPTLRVSGFSSYGDGIIGGVFLGLMPADFKQLLMTETDKVHQAFPTRFERFFIDGTQHTVLLGATGTGVGYDTEVSGVSVDEWLKKMLNGDAGWVDQLQGMDGG